MVRLVLSLFLLLPSPQFLPPHQIVENVSERYGRMNSLSADFEQKSQDSSNQPYQSRGHVYLKSGRRARFEYPGRVEIFDNKTYTVYTPEQKQARQRDISKVQDDRLLIFLILGNRESQWKDQFSEYGTLTDRPQVAGNQVVRLTPKNKEIKEVVVEVDPRSSLIHRFVITKADGERNDYRFTNIKTDPLPDSLFVFKAPDGVDLFKVK